MQKRIKIGMELTYAHDHLEWARSSTHDGLTKPIASISIDVLKNDLANVVPA